MQFQIDVWITFDETEVPPEKVEQARDIAHELDASEVIDYGELRVKYEDVTPTYAQHRAEAILNRVRSLP